MFEVLRMSSDFDYPTELQLLTRLLTLSTQTYLTAVCGTLTETSGVHQLVLLGCWTPDILYTVHLILKHV